jgi:hypothetical protein
MVEYLNHLTDNGFLMFEETVDAEEQAYDYSMLKLLSAVLAAFDRLGIEDAPNHFFVYKWDIYVQVMVKKQAFTKEEERFLLEWMPRTSDPETHNFFIRDKTLVYAPFRRTDTTIGDFIGSLGEDVPTPRVDLSANTDDHPFPFDVYPERAGIKSILWRISLLAIIVAILPALVIFVVKYRSRTVESIPYFLYFGLLGIGYMLVEIVLMQKSQVFLGSPSYSLAGVLGIMLFASSIGSWVSAKLRGRRIMIGLVAVPVLLFALKIGMGHVFSATMGLSVALKIALLSLLIGPAAFFMGMPFPFGLESSKRRFSDEYAALMIAVNGGFCAIGTPLSLLTSTMRGSPSLSSWGSQLIFLPLPLFCPAACRNRKPGLEIGITIGFWQRRCPERESGRISKDRAPVSRAPACRPGSSS